jgi:hypothetical protein
MSKKRKKQPKQEPKMSPQDAYDLCDSFDLPDGAFWAMVEEMSGAEPADFCDD